MVIVEAGEINLKHTGEAGAAGKGGEGVKKPAKKEKKDTSAGSHAVDTNLIKCILLFNI